MKSEAAERIIREFYESFFPLPSQFEKNRSEKWMRRDEDVELMKVSRWWKQWEARLRTDWYVNRGVLLVICVLLVLCFILIVEWEFEEEG